MTEQTSTPTTNAAETRGSGTGLSTADIASAMNPGNTTTNESASNSNTSTPSDATDATMVETRSTGMTASSGSGKRETATPLFQSDETDSFRARWQDIQGTFVDDPRHAVEQGDNLVADIMKRLAELFAEKRSELEKQWEEGQDVSTEDLRVALQSYRSFFDRLLSV